MDSRAGRAVAGAAFRRAWVLAPLALALLAAGCSGGDGPSAAEPSDAEVARVHRGLHYLERACRDSLTVAERERVDVDVDFFLTFAKRYPEAEFPIDDETGRAVSLLLVVREELERCFPAAAARVDQALPEQFRQRLTGYESGGR
jgi:hypothetical protein